METIHPQKLYQKNSRYGPRAPNKKHLDNDVMKHEERPLKVFTLQWILFYDIKFKCSKNNQKEEIECELVEFDHGYETNDNTDFRIETSNNYPLPFNEFYISQNSFNPIQDGPFWGCSQMGETKRSPSLKSVTHILQ